MQEQATQLVELLDKDLEELESMTLFHYWFIIILFENYIPINDHTYANFLSQFYSRFTLVSINLFSTMNIAKMRQILEYITSNFQYLVCISIYYTFL